VLKEAGIEAHYVLLATRGEGKNENALPNVLFNHCIAAVTTSRGIRYLDLTANNFPMGSVPSADLDAFSLDIAPGAKSPTYLLKKNFSASSIHRTATGVLHDDNSVTLKRSSMRTGGATASMRDSYRFKGEEEREKNLVEALGRDFPGVSLKGLTFTDLDAPVDRLGTSYEIEIPRHATESGQFRFMRIPWSDNLSASEAVSYEKRLYAYEYWPEEDTLTEAIELTLPGGYSPVEPKHTVSYSCPIADYKCTLSYTKGVLAGRRQFVNKKYIVDPGDYAAFKKFYNSVVKEDNTQVLLKKK